jgi:hypothetical protein
MDRLSWNIEVPATFITHAAIEHFFSCTGALFSRSQGTKQGVIMRKSLALPNRHQFGGLQCVACALFPLSEKRMITVQMLVGV